MSELERGHFDKQNVFCAAPPLRNAPIIVSLVQIEFSEDVPPVLIFVAVLSLVPKQAPGTTFNTEPVLGELDRLEFRNSYFEPREMIEGKSYSPICFAVPTYLLPTDTARVSVEPAPAADLAHRALSLSGHDVASVCESPKRNLKDES